MLLMVSSAQNKLDQSSAPESARAHLQYIRRTLDAAGRLSSVSGGGMIVIGVLAVGAVLLSERVTGAPWSTGVRVLPAMMVWVVLLIISASVTAIAMTSKAQRAGQPFWSPVLRKAMAICVAPMMLGVILSAASIHSANLAMLPMIWLGCYGAALTSAGVMSVSPVRSMGISFLALALAAAFLPASAGLELLAVGFGGLHLAFGSYIYWRHDG
jgi:hypothetical protein